MGIITGQKWMKIQRSLNRAPIVTLLMKRSQPRRVWGYVCSFVSQIIQKDSKSAKEPPIWSF